MRKSRRGKKKIIKKNKTILADALGLKGLD
jgi:hypothetical protein